MVKTIDRDQYIEEAGLLAADVMKLDVEGGDLELLRSAKGLFDQFRPVPICDALDETLRVWGDYRREIISTLKGADCAWFENCADGAPIPDKIRASYSIGRNQVAGQRDEHARMGRVVNYNERINRIIMFKQQLVRRHHT